MFYNGLIVQLKTGQSAEAWFSDCYRINLAINGFIICLFSDKADLQNVSF
jgi:hypothetical protein